MASNSGSGGVSPEQQPPPTTSPDVTSGVGYAYNIPTAGLPAHPAPGLPPHPPPPKLYNPWPPYMPPGPTQYGHHDSNDPEGFLAHMAALGLPPVAASQPSPQTSFREMGERAAKMEAPAPAAPAAPAAPLDNSCVSPPPTRERFSYTRYQLELLNGMFTKIRYPNSMQKQLIAKRVGITRDQVKIWFQNRRRKDVIGKGPIKDTYSERKMVSDKLLDGVLSELLSYENDPKGRKIKEAIRQKPRKGRYSSQTTSESDENSRSPIHVLPPQPLDSYISEPYRPNFTMLPGHAAPPVPTVDRQSAPGGLTLAVGPSSPTPQMNGGPVMTTLTSQSCIPASGPVDSGVSALQRNINKSPAMLSNVLESVPLPEMGQGLAQPVEEVKSPKSPEEQQQQQQVGDDFKENGPDSEESKILTVLSNLDETSNDSNYSSVSVASGRSSEQISVVSSQNSPASSPNSSDVSSGYPNSSPDTSSITSPPNVQLGPGSRKRSRSGDSLSDDEQLQEPPKKRKEALAENPDSVVPPNKVAPPSEPLKFDFPKMKPMNNMPSSAAPKEPGKPTASPTIIAPQPQYPPTNNEHNMWPNWPGIPGLPTPGRPTPGMPTPNMPTPAMPTPMRPPPESDLNQFNPYLPPLPPQFKPGEMPWSPFPRDLYSLPAGIPGPWDSNQDSHLPDSKAIMELNNMIFPDIKMLGQSEDRQAPHPPHLPIPRPEPLPPWMLTPFNNPYANMAPVPVNPGPDKHSRAPANF